MNLVSLSGPNCGTIFDDLCEINYAYGSLCVCVCAFINICIYVIVCMYVRKM